METAQSDHDLVSRAYAACPVTFLSKVTALVAAEDRSGAGLSYYRRIEQCWDARLADAFLAMAIDPERSAGAAADLLDMGMRHGDRRFAERASELVVVLAARGREKAVAIAAGLLVHAADVGWDTLWSAFQTDPTFGSEVILLAATQVHRDVATIASRLSATQLADLYVWTDRQFPRGEDPKRTSELMSARDSVSWFRDGLIRHLQNSGALETLAAIEQIARVLPDLPWLALTRVLARRAVLRESWLPPTPEAFLRLTRNREERLVESGEQLLEAIADSLDRLEAAFQGETPETSAVWDYRGEQSYFPKDENAFSDHVKRGSPTRLVEGRRSWPRPVGA